MRTHLVALVAAALAAAACGGNIQVPDPGALDSCPNLPGIQVVVPEGHRLEGGVCVQVEEPPPPPPTTTLPPAPPADPDPSPVCRDGETCGCFHRPPPGPWIQLPPCVPAPPVDPNPPPPVDPLPPADVPRADGARIEIARHGVDGYLVTIVPTRGGQDVRPKDRAAAIGPLAWRWSSCHAPGDAPRAWADIAPGQDPLRALVWISAGDCVPKGKTRTRVRVASCLTGVSFEVMIPTGEISRGPAVQPCTPAPPPPPPPPAGTAVVWRDTTDEDVCPKGGADPFGAEVGKVLTDAFGAQGGTWEWDEASLYAFLAPAFRRLGLDVAMYGEELAVARDSSRSANYDLLTTDHGIRRPPGAYQSTCTPATRLAEVVTARPVEKVRAKIHTPPAGGRRGVLDAVALTCDELACGDRLCCPACGEEGSAGRVACDVALRPRWTGGEAHDKNPWLRWVLPGDRARVCVGPVCSDEVGVP